MENSAVSLVSKIIPMCIKRTLMEQLVSGAYPFENCEALENTYFNRRPHKIIYFQMGQYTFLKFYFKHIYFHLKTRDRYWPVFPKVYFILKSSTSRHTVSK